MDFNRMMEILVTIIKSMSHDMKIYPNVMIQQDAIVI